MAEAQKKANSTDVYSKTEADNTFANKATTLAGYGITDAASKTHNHDDRYYTESEVNELIANAVATKSAVQFITWEADD